MNRSLPNNVKQSIGRLLGLRVAGTMKGKLGREVMDLMKRRSLAEATSLSIMRGTPCVQRQAATASRTTTAQGVTVATDVSEEKTMHIIAMPRKHGTRIRKEILGYHTSGRTHGESVRITSDEVRPPP